MIWIRILISWFIRAPRQGSIVYYLAMVVDPYLNLFRRKRMMVGMLDFSPIVAFACIELLQSVLQYFGQYGRLTLGFFLYLFLQFFWGYCLSFFIILAGILLILRTVAVFSRNPNTSANLMRFSMAVNPLVNVIKSIFKAFKRNGEPSERAVTITALVVLVLLFFGLRYLFAYLGRLCLQIPV